jgi:hypothetical protein
LTTPRYGQAMTNTRYGHTNVGGGGQDQPERKDEGWKRRQGGPESRDPGRRGKREERAADDERRGQPPPGTNTQGELAGIGDASEESEATLNAPSQTPPEDQTGVRERDLRGAGTDQPPRMGGPLGSDANDPHLPEGAQDAETRGTGAGGFDRGVNAKVIGAVHQGAREEDPRSTTEG